jgi:hypothetical protein
MLVQQIDLQPFENVDRLDQNCDQMTLSKVASVGRGSWRRRNGYFCGLPVFLSVRSDGL